MRNKHKITRPLLRYHGGKFLLAKWIVAQFPEHRVYVEPFGGAASVLLYKERSYAEIYNDTDEEVVNLFRVVRDRGHELRQRLVHTPFARSEFKLSYEPSDDPIEQARRTVVRSFMGFGSASVSGKKTGFRSNSLRSGTTPSRDWRNYPDALEAIIDRLRGVVIENMDAKDVMSAHDGKNTLHYVDPPYVLDTRYNGQKTRCYRHEMTDEDHERLCIFLKGEIIGYVVLSGYDNEIYNDCLIGWNKHRKSTHTDGAKKRTECLWVNYTSGINGSIW